MNIKIVLCTGVHSESCRAGREPSRLSAADIQARLAFLPLPLHSHNYNNLLKTFYKNTM